jgi:hypothetical protein
MDRWFRAEVQSATGRLHRSLAFMMARYNGVLTESGVERERDRAGGDAYERALVDQYARTIALRR